MSPANLAQQVYAMAANLSVQAQAQQQAPSVGVTELPPRLRGNDFSLHDKGCTPPVVGVLRRFMDLDLDRRRLLPRRCSQQRMQGHRRLRGVASPTPLRGNSIQPQATARPPRGVASRRFAGSDKGCSK